jgi:hypothetical protein
MAAIVKANSSLASGGLAVLRRSYSTTDDGTCNYEAEYCCLAQFTSNHAGRFRTGAQPPTPIPTSMSQLRLSDTPTLYDLTTRTENGLTYFSARYTAASNDPGEVITTETSEQRSFSATVRASVQVAGNNNSLSTVEGFVAISFDYISKTVRVEAKNPRSLPLVRGSVSLPFNKAVGTISAARPILLSEYRQQFVETDSTIRSSRGVYTYTKSSTGIYEVNPAYAV